MSELEPIPIHLASVGTGVSLGAAPPGPPRRLRRTTFQTVVLTPGEPVQEILPASEDRIIAYVQALDFDVILGRDTNQAGAASNTAATPATPPNPSGTVLPKANTTPWPIDDTGVVKAGITNTAANSRVAITAVYKVTS